MMMLNVEGNEGKLAVVSVKFAVHLTTSLQLKHVKLWPPYRSQKKMMGPEESKPRFWALRQDST